MHNARRISRGIWLRRSPNGPLPRGFSLVEMLLVVAIMGVMAAAIIPFFDPLADVQLRSVAEVVAADLAYAQNLAVSHQSNYLVAFSTADNQYTLTHSGSNALLNTLPRSPFHQSGDTPDRLTVRIDNLPQMSHGAALAKVVKLTPLAVAVGDVEFGPYGATTRSETTVVWLQFGRGESYRSVKITIDPITGIANIGPIESTLPP